MREYGFLGVTKIIFRVVCFFFVGCILFLCLQRLMIPKWNYPVMVENVSDSLESFYSQESDLYDVLFLGTSHMVYSISPMHLYDEYGISSYNLGSSGQRISGSYYLLKEALKKQTPKVVVLDVSNLFLSEYNEAAWRYILDTMPETAEKAAMAADYAAINRYQEDIPIVFDHSYVSALLPLFYYHDRWKELSSEDFRDYYKSDSYFTAGYFLCPIIVSRGKTVTIMNDVADEMATDNEKRVYSFTDTLDKEDNQEDVLYSTQISKENKEWFDKIVQLCSDNNIQLLLTKIPAIDYPNNYESAWTKIKYERIKKFANKRNIVFYDMLYEDDIGFDMDTDFVDGGVHFNYKGAVKATHALGNYLITNYGLSSKKNAIFDKNMDLFREICRCADLEMEQNFSDYLEYLNEIKEQSIILIASQDEMTEGLNEEEIKGLKELGLSADYKTIPAYRDSYIAVIDGGTVLYETASNRKLTYSTSFNGNAVSIISSGWKTGPYASIKIENEENAINTIGINMVICDKQSGLVIDSIAVNTNRTEPHTVAHVNTLDYLSEYWQSKVKS